VTSPSQGLSSNKREEPGNEIGCERALEIRKEQLGPNHVDVASYYNKLARLSDIGELEHSGVFCCCNNICIIF
jgi:hypothetical protein